jgi:hypothetical protein
MLRCLLGTPDFHSKNFAPKYWEVVPAKMGSWMLPPSNRLAMEVNGRLAFESETHPESGRYTPPAGAAVSKSARSQPV